MEQFLLNVFVYESIVLLLHSPFTAANITSWTLGGSTPVAAFGWVTGYHEALQTVWLIGGYTTSFGNSVRSFNTLTEEWDNTHDGLSSITELDCNGKKYATIDEIIYFSFNGLLAIFDMNTGTNTYPWPAGESEKYTMLADVDCPCMATDGRYLFLTGGDSSAVFQIYDTLAEEWTSGPDLLENRMSSSCEVFNGYLYVFGGGTQTTS